MHSTFFLFPLFFTFFTGKMWFWYRKKPIPDQFSDWKADNFRLLLMQCSKIAWNEHIISEALVSTAALLAKPVIIGDIDWLKSGMQLIRSTCLFGPKRHIRLRVNKFGVCFCFFFCICFCIRFYSSSKFANEPTFEECLFFGKLTVTSTKIMRIYFFWMCLYFPNAMVPCIHLVWSGSIISWIIIWWNWAIKHAKRCVFSCWNNVIHRFWKMAVAAN